VVSGPNIAAFNHGDVRQNSGNDVDSSARNSLTQSNDQSNDLDQKQSVEGGRCCPEKDNHGYWGKEGGEGCCAKDGGGATQTADQSNWAKNDADQDAYSIPIVKSGDNIAVFNGGPVHQNSGNDVDSSAKNSLWQSNDQSNDLDQRQTVHGGKADCRPKCEPRGCEPKQCKPKECNGKEYESKDYKSTCEPKFGEHDGWQRA
jgi:hypothetical protein